MTLPVRDGCCADWPKPCPYHEGVQDAIDALEQIADESKSEAKRLAIVREGLPDPQT